MSRPTTRRRLIWVALGIQFLGLVFDYAWHGLHPDVTPVTVREMIAHLSTVHLPLYVGVLSVLVTTAWALVGQMRQSQIGIALPVAFVGALVAAAGEGWHAYTHLQLSTHSGPIAGTTALVGFIVVVSAMWLAGRHEWRRAADGIDQRRPA
jgi:type IV secretory pathway VirB2 component (pilin)